MTTAFIALDHIADAAEARGFRVTRWQGSLEIFAPEHTGPDAVWSNGCCYSAATFNLNDRPGIGYGYNAAFYGPFHPGMCHRDDYALGKLMAHPAMAGAL